MYSVSLKKTLSLLVAFAMVFGMIAMVQPMQAKAATAEIAISNGDFEIINNHDNTFSVHAGTRENDGWTIDKTFDIPQCVSVFVPKAEDIDLTDLDFDIETLKSILAVDKDIWTKEAAEIEEHYKKFGDKLPAQLREQLENLKAALK